jgi:hypothetical protein
MAGGGGVMLAEGERMKVLPKEQGRKSRRGGMPCLALAKQADQIRCICTETRSSCLEEPLKTPRVGVVSV